MNVHRSDRQGVTWLRPLSRVLPQGVTWLVAVAVSTTALLAATAAPTVAPAPGHDVGFLSAASVELLGAQDAGSIMSLGALDAQVRNGTFGDGSGIDVALIDTGVAPVDGLTTNVLHGPDLSFEAQSPESAFIDTYGHGTHMAGIIAGNRIDAEGVAPGARIVSLKVAGHDGVTTVPQVVAAIDWVVDHHDSNGLNIRVLNLSLGQQGVDSHVGDLLSAAVERAWQAGIFVVVAAGNNGDAYSHLDSPAIDPYVLAVGAADGMSSNKRNRLDVPSWSAVGDTVRNPDVVAGGRSIASYRVPGSTLDTQVPSARVGASLFLGSGTSQAAAAVSGLAAAILSENPGLDNDDLKATLKAEADDLRREPETTSGKGLVDGAAALDDPRTATQVYPPAAGSGTGIVTPTGATWSGGTWSGATWSGATWSGATWSGGTWSGATWSGATWSGATWSGATWSGATWSGATWSGATWSGATWSGATWSGSSWSTDGTTAALTSAPVGPEKTYETVDGSTTGEPTYYVLSDAVLLDSTETLSP